MLKDKIMGNFTKERVPAICVEDKYIDALLENNFPSISLDISIIVILLRYEDTGFTVKKLSELLHFPEIQIESSLINLGKIGFFDSGYYTKI